MTDSKEELRMKYSLQGDHGLVNVGWTEVGFSVQRLRNVVGIWQKFVYCVQVGWGLTAGHFILEI